MSLYLSRILLPLENVHLHKNLFHTSSLVSQKKNKIHDDSEVLLYGDSKTNNEKMTFGTLKVLAKKEKEEKGKNLVQITTKGEQKKLLPTFKIVNDAALEVLLRKSRSNQTNESFAVFDLDGSESAAKRVKQKTYIISYDSQPNVIEASVNKMRKELEKSNFVAIKIKSSGQNETQLKDFENMLYTKCLDGGLESKKSLITSRVIS